MKYYLAYSESGVSHWQFEDTDTVEEIATMVGDAIGETVDELREITRQEYDMYEN